MAEYTASGNFTPTSGTAAYRLDIAARTSQVTGGTLVEIYAAVTMTRNPGTPASGTATRSWTLTGGRDTSTSGPSSTSGSSTMSYAFTTTVPNTIVFYNYFNKYVAYSQGPSTDLSVTIYGGGSSSFFTTKTLNLTVPLFTASPVTVNSYPSISGTGYVGSSISASSGSYNNISGSPTLKIVTSTSTSLPITMYGTNSNLGNPYTVTSTDALSPQNRFIAVDVVTGIDGQTYYFYSSGQGGAGTTSVSTSSVITAVQPTYSVTYNMNGATSGSPPVDSNLYQSGQTVTLGYQGSMSWTGRYFNGWYISNVSPNYFSAGSTFSMPSSNVTVYALWVANTYTLYYDANGGSVSPSSKSITYNSPYGTLPTPTRTGYQFNGWFTAITGGTQVTESTTYTTASDSTIFAQWTAQIPVFSDQEITTTGVLSKDINTNIDYTVSAAPVTSFSIVYSGTGLDPTSWLTITKESGTNNGILAGKPTQIGTYTFIVRATNSGGGDTDSSLITLVVSPAGKRFTTSGTTQLSVAKRFDGTNWVNLKIMRRFDGTAWQDIGNI